MSVAVLEARNALPIVARIADKERPATSTLRAHSVIEAIEANVQLIGVWSGTFRMPITSALDTAVGANEAKMATADVRLEAISMNATL